MEPVRSLLPEIDALLARGGVLLTGNQRAARTLRLDFDRQRHTQGLASWRPPAIFAWDTWLASLWQQALLDGRTERMLLNRTQELQLWRSIITADSSSDSQWSSLQSIDSLAAMASAAWQQLCRYRGQSRLIELGVSGDTRAFQRWAQAFVRRCRSDLYLSPSELEAALISSSFKPAVEELLLTGFDVLTPAQTALLETFRKASVVISHQPPSLPAPESYLAATNDLDDELTQAAHRLRQALKADPAVRIAVIHPNVASERAGIDRVFREMLAPELNDITADPTASPFEFSLGQPLSHQPMVAVAIKLLRWSIAPLAITDISHLLLSPCFASAPAERHALAEFDAFELRTNPGLRPELSLPDLIKLIEPVTRRDPSLSSIARQLHALLRSASRLLPDDKQRSFSDYADTVRDLLHSAAWASSAADTSIEFQTRRKWESVLDELSTLDFEGVRTSFAEALNHLEQIAQRTLFAPESCEAPIQIMSPLEAAGSRFDVLYFLRAADSTWLTRPGMNPLLGWRLQRDLRMPGSDAAQDAEHASRITARLAASARTVIFSYARETEDAHQRSSPALAELSLTSLPALQPPAPPAAVALEALEDTGSVPLRNLKVQGGAGILKLQAACGFRAFAEKRLWSTATESREPGMDARERGNIVHVALEHLWIELGTQARLRALTSDERAAALSRAIDRSLSDFQKVVASAWDAAYLDIQRDRLHRLLSAWLELELTRSPFEVELREQKYGDAAIGPLLLSLRVDRIDRVFSESGEELGEVILDYKTGIAGPSDWQGERPDEPQLPLYAALREPGTVAGITFASLRPGKDMDFRGYAAERGILPKPSPLKFATLEDQIADWYRVLTNLAIDFAEGDARVLPKSYPDTCEHCRQRILCRLDSTALEELIKDAGEIDA